MRLCFSFPSQCGLPQFLIFDGYWLSNSIHQLPQYPQMPFSRLHGLVHPQVPQMVLNKTFSYSAWFFILQSLHFTSETWAVRVEHLMVKTEAKKLLSISVFSSLLLLACWYCLLGWYTLMDFPFWLMFLFTFMRSKPVAFSFPNCCISRPQLIL